MTILCRKWRGTSLVAATGLALAAAGCRGSSASATSPSRGTTVINEEHGGLKPGARIELTLDREGDRRTVTVTLDAAMDPEEPESRSPSTRPERGGIVAHDLGLDYSDVTPTLAKEFGLKGKVKGVIITDVDPASEAFREANIRPGQLIIAVNRKPVENAAASERIYAAIEAGSSFLVRLLVPDENSTMVTALRKPRQ